MNFGIVRNTRPCETTEFGLKSQVWNQSNGLCNFASLPTPNAMRQADKRGDSLISGQMTLYFNRASVFTIWLRPAGVNPDTAEEYAWEPLGEQFAIRGARPVDQYNYLRIIHAQTREYEFKFAPKNGSDLTQFTPDDAEFWLLDARLADWKRQGVILDRPYTTPYGTFNVQAAGRTISKGELEFAPEMSTGVKTNTDDQPLINAPQSVTIAGICRTSMTHRPGQQRSRRPVTAGLHCLRATGTDRQRSFADLWQGQFLRPDRFLHLPAQQPARRSLARTEVQRRR